MNKPLQLNGKGLILLSDISSIEKLYKIKSELKNPTN